MELDATDATDARRYFGEGRGRVIAIRRIGRGDAEVTLEEVRRSHVLSGTQAAPRGIPERRMMRARAIRRFERLCGSSIITGAERALARRELLRRRSLREGDEEASDDDPTIDDSAGAPSTPKSSSSTPPAKAKGACAGEATQKACFECCEDKAPQAVDFYTRALESCLCQSPGSCQAACGATLCSGFKADAACADCLRTTGLACEDSAFTACENEASCGPMLTCASESRCSSK